MAIRKDGQYVAKFGNFRTQYVAKFGNFQAVRKLPILALLHTCTAISVNYNS